jgi:hypothetical protein
MRKPLKDRYLTDYDAGAGCVYRETIFYAFLAWGDRATAVSAAMRDAAGQTRPQSGAVGLDARVVVKREAASGARCSQGGHSARVVLEVAEAEN